MLLLRALVCGLIAIAITLSAHHAASEANAAEPVTADTSDLQTRLEKDLRARRPVEFIFIARVVQLVNQGDLPLSLVDSTYLWARSKPIHPFQYFERAIRVQAAKLGVEI